MIPLLSPKPFSAYSAEEYKAYIESLYKEPEKAAPPADFNVRINKKGTPVIRINRKPKFIYAKEIAQIAQDIGWPYQKLWLHFVKKKIEIRKSYVTK